MKIFFILLTMVAVAAMSGCRSMNENNSNSNVMTVNTNSLPQNSLGNMNGAPVP